MAKISFEANNFRCIFHHVQLYVDSLTSIEKLKQLESALGELALKGSFEPFSGKCTNLSARELPQRLKNGEKAWIDICHGYGGNVEVIKPSEYNSFDQDFVEQLVVGLGWRVTASHENNATKSLLVGSPDSQGVKFVVTAPKPETDVGLEDNFEHFKLEKLTTFRSVHNGLQGISVLGFELPDEGALEELAKRYKEKHPLLYVGEYLYHAPKKSDSSDENATDLENGIMKILEVFAYYARGGSAEKKKADEGTVLRFLYRTGSFSARASFGNPHGVLPGLTAVPAKFDGTSIPAYADHWVSNVFDRQTFLDTLNDVLGFEPKVDFNAGIISAGSAQIESTVTGNDSLKTIGKQVSGTTEAQALRDQSQIYLPTNNAMSEVGHVHLFLEQYGQGIQHLASRVVDLVAFIERVNNYRSITGRGFSFLSIPRSYYGVLYEKELEAVVDDKELAKRIFGELVKKNMCSPAGVVSLDLERCDIEECLRSIVSERSELELKSLVNTISISRYSNMLKLLGDHFDEQKYLQIVRNKVLVDVQGNDVLFQIFTANILQRKSSDEAPFLEFIQRVCSQKNNPNGTAMPIKPGCGGFGIRNFLTLFLSIEASKAMNGLETALEKGDTAAAELFSKRVDLFTRQLSESNPILTEISNAMTAEGNARKELEKLLKDPNEEGSEKVKELQKLAEDMKARKQAGNDKLQILSDAYNKEMEALNGN